MTDLVKGAVFRKKGDWITGVRVVACDEFAVAYQRFIIETRTWAGETYGMARDVFLDRFEPAESAFVFFPAGEAPRPVYAEVPPGSPFEAKP